MAFRFPLRALLRLRQGYERREQLRLQILTRELHQARQRLETLNQEQTAARKQLEESLRAGMAGAELHFEVACAAERAKHHKALAEQSVKLAAQRENQLGIFRRAQQQRKVVESLRDRQYELYRRIQARRAQQQMDELFLFRGIGSSSG